MPRQLLLEWADRQGRDCLKVSGWPEAELREIGHMDAGDLSRRLSVLPSDSLTDGGHVGIPPVAGSFVVEGGSVWFVPRFPFVDGMSYSLLVDGDGGLAEPEVWAIQRTAATGIPTTEVLEIYPTAATLPFNLLRVYVHFSSPMSEGWACRSVRVCRADTGEPLEDVFLPPDPELWDPERRRLTMLLDPGRIKRGLAPNREFGYPLAEGMEVRITVDAGFRDAKGRPLKAASERRYRVGPALRSRIDPAGWRLTAPAAGSSVPLVVDFGRPLDHGLLQHCLWVTDGAGNRVPGAGAPCAGEQGWRFVPSVPWRRGEHRLVIDSRLEDVAGNSPVHVFDRDIARQADAPLRDGLTEVSFVCAADPGAPQTGASAGNVQSSFPSLA